ncbi:MAG: putative peptidoglycan glycosyltransferase FtsW [Acutalibacteraceae bacterium]|nr:putative peptidoglycan glycosyltransferase FtsW [Acutalibacteraceae bacterium]
MSSEQLRQTAEKNSTASSSKKSKSKFRLFGLDVFIGGGFDIVYMVLVLMLLTVGLVMMFSASYISAKYDSATNYDATYYIKRQLGFALVGVALMFIISRINPELMKKVTPIIFAVSLVLLVLVLIHPYRLDGKEDFKRWLKLGIVFQPSDVAKLGIIMFFAWLLEKYRHQIETKWWVSLALFGLLGFLCVLIYLEKHLSCTILIMLIGIGMLFLGGVDRRWFILGFTVGILLIAVVVIFRDQLLDPYQADRIDSFIHKDYDDVDSRWQTNQSLFALGSGGFFGLGLGQSRQKYLYMPEPQNDFIFAIVGEELGFFRSMLIILLFAALVFRGFVIATKAKSMFERLLVLGISLQVGLQTILNILVVTDLMPNTGISLPFFSYGGTALVMQLVEMGMVLAVSRSGERKKRAEKNA